MHKASSLTLHGFDLFIPLLLFLVTLSGVSQNLEGEFVNYEKGVTTSITFIDSSFQRASGMALNHSATLSKGIFRIKNDTVYLQYTPWTDMVRKSRYEVISRSATDPDIMMLNISIFDRDGNKITQEPIFYTLKAKDSVIAGFVVRNTNEITYMDGDESVSEILIRGLPHRMLSVPLSGFVGSISDIKVTLVVDDGKEYFDSDRTEKYYWDKDTGILYFINDKGERGIQYKRIDR